MTRTARALALLASAALVLTTPATAHAGKPYEMDRYSFPYSFTNDDFCGITVDVEGEASGVFFVLPVKGSDGQAFFGHDNYEFSEVVSTEDGWIRVEGNGVFREQKATHISGTIWEFQWLDAGTFRVYDSEGNLLVRANGVFKASEQFDTLGDSQPGGEPVEGTFEVLAEHGQTFPGSEFCATVLPELT